MIPAREIEEVEEVLLTYGLEKKQSTLVAKALSKRPEAWIDFMMRFELGLEKPAPKRALKSALTIAISYIASGLIPLAPYMLISNTGSALIFSTFFRLRHYSSLGMSKPASLAGIPFAAHSRPR
jgi:VIT1/CCC1 family predicted Fe2+/Mn2+ transporter